MQLQKLLRKTVFLVRKLAEEEAIYKEAQKTDCTAKMISYAVIWKPNSESCETIKKKNNDSNESKQSQNGKGSASDHQHDNKRRSTVNCKYCDKYKTSI